MAKVEKTSFIRVMEAYHIKAHTNWQQKIPIETTIKDMLEYWRKVL